MTLQGMYRIAAKDADALGRKRQPDSTDSTQKNSERGSTFQEPVQASNEIKENLKSVFDPEIPVNVVDLGLIYRVSKLRISQEKVGGVAFVDLTLTAPGLWDGTRNCGRREGQGFGASRN